MVVVVAGLACDGSLTPAPAIAPPRQVTAADTIAQAVARAICAKVDECCTAADRTRVLGAGDDKSACELSYGSFYGRQYSGISSVLEGGYATFDAAALEPCVAAYRAAGCQAPGFVAAPVCHKVLVGSVTNGDTCLSGFECQSRLCPPAAPDVARTCGPRRSDGQACMRDGECASGLCRMILFSGSCAPRPVGGDACVGEGFWLVL